MKSKRGSALLIVLGVLVLLGGATAVFKPAWLSGASKRAKASQEATARLLEAARAQSAAAAAGVTMIGKANSMAPESPAKDFVGWEVPAVLTKLEPADPMELLAAEKRRSAVMEGRLDEAQRLYLKESERSTELKKERDAAVAQRQKADLAISESAAAQLALERQRNIVFAVGGLLVAMIIYLKYFSVSTSGMGRILTDLRSAVPGQERAAVIAAIDGVTSPWHQKKIRSSYEKQAADEAGKKASAAAAAVASTAP